MPVRTEEERKQSQERKKEGEPYINPDTVGIAARSLQGRKGLDVANPIETFSGSSVTPETIAETTQAIADSSFNERVKFFNTGEYKNMNFEDRKERWRQSFSSMITRGNTNTDQTYQAAWKEVWENFEFADFADQDKPFTAADADRFFSALFHDRTNAYRTKADVFIERGLGLYRDNGQLYHRGTREELETKVQILETIGRHSIGDISGRFTAQFIDSIAAWRDEQTRPMLIEEANKMTNGESRMNGNNLQPYEQELLNGVLTNVQQAQTLQPTAPGTIRTQRIMGRPESTPQPISAARPPGEKSVHPPAQVPQEPVPAPTDVIQKNAVPPVVFQAQPDQDKTPAPREESKTPATDALRTELNESLSHTGDKYTKAITLEQARDYIRENVHLKAASIMNIKIEHAYRAIEMTLAINAGKNRGEIKIEIENNPQDNRIQVKNKRVNPLSITSWTEEYRKNLNDAIDHINQALTTFIEQQLVQDHSWNVSGLSLDLTNQLLNITFRKKQEPPSSPLPDSTAPHQIFDATNTVNKDAENEDEDVDEVGVSSSASEKHAGHNEDKLFKLSKKRAYGLFDGNTRPSGGDIAAATARDYIGLAIQRLPDTLSTRELGNELEQILTKAGESIFQKGIKMGRRRIATTASIIILQKDFIVAANIGDSRVYIRHAASGELEQITLDHNLFWVYAQTSQNELAARELQKRISNAHDASELSKDDRQYFPPSTLEIAHVLGNKGKIHPNIYSLKIELGDEILLVSDGISDVLTDTEMNDILANNPPQDAAEKLVEHTKNENKKPNNPRAKYDDKTAIVVKVNKIT